MTTNKLEIFINRLKKININVELFGNYPWIYLDKINNVKVKETYLAHHGFTIAFLPVKKGEEISFINIKDMFIIIRKYTNK